VFSRKLILYPLLYPLALKNLWVRVSPQGEGIGGNPTASGWGIKKISINLPLIFLTMIILDLLSPFGYL
jgi:hypothetical protein